MCSSNDCVKSRDRGLRVLGHYQETRKLDKDPLTYFLRSSSPRKTHGKPLSLQ